MRNEYDVSAKNLSDEELVELYKNNESDALLILLSRYIDIINKKIYSNFRLTFSENDDIKQEALIVFINSIRTYDVEKGSKFSTYSSKCIDNMIKNQAKSIIAKKTTMLSNSLAIDNIDSSIDQTYELLNPEQLYINKEKYDYLLYKIDLVLSELEKNVLFLYLENNNYSVISNIISQPIKTVDNAMQRARKKLKEIIL